MNRGVRCEVVSDDPDYLLVRVSASNGEFSGSAEAYINPDEAVELAAKLNGFPLSPSDSREIILGTFDPGYAGGGARVRFFCKGSSGPAWAEVTLKAGMPVAGIIQSAYIVIPVEATEIDLFVRDLRRLNLTTNRVAILKPAPRMQSSFRVPYIQGDTR